MDTGAAAFYELYTPPRGGRAAPAAGGAAREYLWQLPQHAWTPLGLVVLSGPHAADFVDMQAGEWISTSAKARGQRNAALFQDEGAQQEDRERVKHGICLGAHLRVACSSGRRFDAYRTSLFPSSLGSSTASLHTSESAAIVGAPPAFGEYLQSQRKRKQQQRPQDIGDAGEPYGEAPRDAAFEDDESCICFCVWANLSDLLRGADARRSPVTFAVSSAEAFLLHHLLPLSFPLRSALRLLQTPSPPLASLARAAIQRLSHYHCKHGQLPAKDNVQRKKAEGTDEEKAASPVSSGGDFHGATLDWESLASYARGSTDPEEWRHFMAFASALLEASIPGGLFQQKSDHSPEGPRGMQRLQQQQKMEKMLCRKWLKAVEAAILKGHGICGGWGCIVHCAAAPQAATVARHFDFAAARAWGVKADPSVDGSGAADFPQLLQRACAQQQGKQQAQPQSSPTAAASGAPDGGLLQCRDCEISHNLNSAATFCPGEDVRQQRKLKKRDPGELSQGLCHCHLCGLSPLQMQRVLCLLDPRSISAFGCTSRAHWAAAQAAVSGLEAVGSGWIHSPAGRSAGMGICGGEDGHFLYSSNIASSVVAAAGEGKEKRRPGSRRGGLFRHQVHALLWLRHRERRMAPQQPPADIRLLWRLLGSSSCAQQAAEEGSATELAFQRLKGNISSSVTSAGDGKRKGDTSPDIAWPRPRQNCCRPADDLLKGLATWIELALPQSSWLAEAHGRVLGRPPSNLAKKSPNYTAGGDIQTGDLAGMRLLQGQGKCLRVFGNGHPQLLSHSVSAVTYSPATEEGEQPALLPHTLDTAKAPGDFSLYVSFDFKTAMLGYAGASRNSMMVEAEERGREEPDTECIGGMFCDDPGLGKTLSLLSLAVVSRCRVHLPPRHLWPPPQLPSSFAVLPSAAPPAQRKVSDPPFTRTTRRMTRQSRSLQAQHPKEPSCRFLLWRIPAATVTEHFRGIGAASPSSGISQDAGDRFSGIAHFFCYNDPVLSPRALLPIEGSQRLAEDLSQGHLLTEWQLRGSEAKAEVLKSRLQRVYRDLKIEANTSRQGCHGLLLESLVDDALRMAELQDAQARKILRSCSNEKTADAPTFFSSATAAAQVPFESLRCKREQKPLDGPHEDTPAVVTTLHSKRQRRTGMERLVNAGSTDTTDSAAAAKATEPPAPPPSVPCVSCPRRRARLEQVPVLDGTPLRSPPRFLCSSTTLVICPPFLARHWEAQLEQWFGWHHLPASDRMKVLVFERPADLAAVSRFDVAASDVVVVTTNVLTKEFSRCLINPLETPEQVQQKQAQQQRCRSGAVVSGAEAENRFWQQFIVETKDEAGESMAHESMAEATVLQRFATVMPAEQQQHLASMLKRRIRQPQHNNFTSQDATGPNGTNPLLCAKSPLLGVHFARIAVDEGHRLVQSGSLHVQLACSLRADKRWVLTGTPTSRLSADRALAGLRAICEFLRHPLTRRRFFTGGPQGGTSVFRSSIVRGVCEYGMLFAHYRLHCLLDGLLVRHTKALCRLLPPLKGPVVYSIRMAEQEKTTYNDLVELTRRNLFCTYFTRTNPDSLFHSSNRSSASTVLWNLRFSCTLTCQAHLLVQRKWVDETLQMLADKHPKYQNQFPYKYDFNRLVFVTAVFLRVSSVERQTVQCDMCCRKIRFPLLVPCRMLHLLCSACLFPNFLAESFCSRPAVAGCPLCWPWCPVNGDFMDRLQPPVEHTTHFDWPYSAAKGRAQQARALARTEASFAAATSSTVFSTSPASPPRIQVELRSPCVWPKPPVLPLRQRSAAAEAAVRMLLNNSTNSSQEHNQQQVKSPLPRRGCCHHNSFSVSIFAPEAVRSAPCCPTLWLSADILQEAENMVEAWHQRLQIRPPHPPFVAMPSCNPQTAAATAAPKAEAVTSTEGETTGATLAASPAEEAKAAPATEIPSEGVGTGKTLAAAPAPTPRAAATVASPPTAPAAEPVISGTQLSALKAAALEAASAGEKAAPAAAATTLRAVTPEPSAGFGIAAKQHKGPLSPFKGSSDRQSNISSSTGDYQHFFPMASPAALASKEKQRRLFERDEKTPIDLVDVEDLQHFVGCDVRMPRGSTSGLMGYLGFSPEAFKNLSAHSCSPLGRAVAAAASAAASEASPGDKLASLHVDVEDQSFLRSSKYAAVARRILALIESRRFGQNNIPWEELSDPDPEPVSDLGFGCSSPPTRRVRFAPPEECSGDSPDQQQGAATAQNTRRSQYDEAAAVGPPRASALKVKQTKGQGRTRRCEKIIVAASFWESLFLLGQFLERHNIRCGHFTERTERKTSLAALRNFVEDDVTQVLLLSTSVGAHGLDLSCASHVLLLDPPTDPNVEQQVVARAHRMGALRPVHVELFVLRDSVEESILAKRADWSIQDSVNEEADTTEEANTAAAVHPNSSALTSGPSSPLGFRKACKGRRAPREGCGSTREYLRISKAKSSSATASGDAGPQGDTREEDPQRQGVEIFVPAEWCPWPCDEKVARIRLMPQPSWETLLVESRGRRDALQQSTETLLRTLKFVQ